MLHALQDGNQLSPHPREMSLGATPLRSCFGQIGTHPETSAPLRRRCVLMGVNLKFRFLGCAFAVPSTEVRRSRVGGRISSNDHFAKGVKNAQRGQTPRSGREKGASSVELHAIKLAAAPSLIFVSRNTARPVSLGIPELTGPQLIALGGGFVLGRIPGGYGNRPLYSLLDL